MANVGRDNSFRGCRDCCAENPWQAHLLYIFCFMVHLAVQENVKQKWILHMNIMYKLLNSVSSEDPLFKLNKVCLRVNFLLVEYIDNFLNTI